VRENEKGKEKKEKKKTNFSHETPVPSLSLTPLVPLLRAGQGVPHVLTIRALSLLILFIMSRYHFVYSYYLKVLLTGLSRRNGGTRQYASIYWSVTAAFGWVRSARLTRKRLSPFRWHP